MIQLATICATGVHCAACRALSGDGSEFRVGLAQAYTMPPDWPVCPHGRPWGYAGNAPPHIPIGLGDWLHIALVRLGVDRLWAWMRRGKRCGCAQRRAWLNGNTRVIAAAALAPLLALVWGI